MKVAIVTVSDRCSRGEAEDRSGDNLQQLINVDDLLSGGNVEKRLVVPDEINQIQDVLLQLSESGEVDVIFTTGGTGFSPRDVTPEAVRKVIQKEAIGLTIAMMTKSLEVTSKAMLARPVCGIRNKTIIITLPGSKKGSEECFRFVASELKHAVDLLQDRKPEVEATHRQVQGSHCCHGSKTNVSVDEVARRPRKSPYPIITVEEAQKIIIQQSYIMDVETKNYRDALGFVLSESVYAEDPLPPFPASVKDGYGVITSDGCGVREVLGDSTAGKKGIIPVVFSGSCVRVSTGAAVPEGADAVVQVEDTKLIESSSDGKEEVKIEILVAPTVGQDIRPIGCDIQEGQKVLEKGTLLGPSELGVLASVGRVSVSVYRKPITGVMSTGDELLDPEEKGVTGIRDSNRTALLSVIKQEDFPTVDCGIVRDEPEAVRSALHSALSTVDLLVTSGGVSMGERDVLKPVLEQDFGATIHFARVFMKPGKPTTFATCTFNGKKKLILGLPGNPVSCAVTSQLYVLPILRSMSAHLNSFPIKITAKIDTAFTLDPRPEYHRVLLTWKDGDPVPVAQSTGNQMSSRLLSMRGANALLMLPPKSETKHTVNAGSQFPAIIMH